MYQSLRMEDSMKKTLFIIIILISSLILVSCATDAPEQEQGTNIEPDTEAPVDENEDIVEEDSNDLPNENGFIYSVDNIAEFKLEIELLNEDEIDYDFNRNENRAKIQRENGEEIELTGQEAMDEIFNMLENIEVNLDRTLNDMMEDALTYLEISMDEVNEFELELEFLDSKEIDFKYDKREGSENRQVEEFDLDIDFWDGSEWDFDYDLNDEYEIQGVENLRGEEARTQIEELIEAINISMDSTIGEIKDNLFDHLDINEEDVEDFDLDLEYVDGMEIDVKVHY